MMRTVFHTLVLIAALLAAPALAEPDLAETDLDRPLEGPSFQIPDLSDDVRRLEDRFFDLSERLRMMEARMARRGMLTQTQDNR